MVGREGAMGGNFWWGGGSGLGGTGDRGMIFPSCSIHLGGDRRGVVNDVSMMTAGSSSRRLGSREKLPGEMGKGRTVVDARTFGGPRRLVGAPEGLGGCGAVAVALTAEDPATGDGGGGGRTGGADLAREERLLLEVRVGGGPWGGTGR